MTTLFEPVRLGELELPNRIVMAPMTRNRAVGAIDAFGPHRVGVRLSPGGSFNDMSDADPAATFGHAATALDRLACGFLHVVENRVAGGSAIDLVRRHYHGPIVSAGGYERATAIDAVESGRADAIAFARHYIANPDLVERLRNDWPLATSNRRTYYGGSDAGYTDYAPYTLPGSLDQPELR
jgi:N-ethylmaleimide reductase